MKKPNVNPVKMSEEEFNQKYNRLRGDLSSYAERYSHGGDQNDFQDMQNTKMKIAVLYADYYGISRSEALQLVQGKQIRLGL